MTYIQDLHIEVHKLSEIILLMHHFVPRFFSPVFFCFGTGSRFVSKTHLEFTGPNDSQALTSLIPGTSCLYTESDMTSVYFTNSWCSSAMHISLTFTRHMELDCYINTKVLILNLSNLI